MAAANWLYPFSSFFSTKSLVRSTGKNLIVLLYHGLNEDNAIPFIDPLYSSRSITQFEQDLSFLNKHFQSVSLQEIIDKKGILEKPSYHITFDDGLSSVYNLALPILKKYKVTATVFLNNNFIDSKELFYRYKVALILDRTEKDPTSRQVLVDFIKVEKGNSIKSYLLNLGYEDQKKIDEYGDVIKLDFDQYLQQEKPYLSADQIRKLYAEGISFGGHTYDHAPIYKYNEAEQQKQIEESVSDLRKRFMFPISTFAFPFTDFGVNRKLFSKMDIDLFFGTAGLKDDHQKAIQRLPIETSNESAEKYLKNELLYYKIKGLIGKNKMGSGL